MTQSPERRKERMKVTNKRGEKGRKEGTEKCWRKGGIKEDKKELSKVGGERWGDGRKDGN